MANEKLTVTVEDPETGDEIEVAIPARFEVCDRCEGRGTHVNPAVDGNGLSQEDFDGDPDLRENYFGGMYDVSCEDCGGKRVVLVPDEKNADSETKKLIEAHHNRQREAAEWAAADSYTRRMENGGY